MHSLLTRDTADTVMPGRSMAGRGSLKPATSVRFAPRQSTRREAQKVRGVVKATVTSVEKKHTVSARSLLLTKQIFVAGSVKWQAHWL